MYFNFFKVTNQSNKKATFGVGHAGRCGTFATTTKNVFCKHYDCKIRVLTSHKRENNFESSLTSNCFWDLTGDSL